MLIQNRKICGILQESVKIEKKFNLIVGIGINTLTSPKNTSFKGISLLESSGKLVDNFTILNNLKNKYETIFYNHKFNKELIKR